MVDHTLVTYLGPPGTFSHEAAITFFPTPGDNRLQPLPTIPTVLESIRSGSSRFGIVPIENSVHGEVTTTLDALVFDFTDIYVCGEVVVPVTFSAFRRHNVLGLSEKSLVTHMRLPSVAASSKGWGNVEDLTRPHKPVNAPRRPRSLGCSR